MDEEVIMQNLVVGIWTIHSDGISCTPKKLPKRQIGKSMIFKTMKVGSDFVWDLPIHLACQTWMTHENMKHLMQALSIYRFLYPQHLEFDNIVEMDKKSLWLGLAVIDNREVIGDIF